MKKRFGYLVEHILPSPSENILDEAGISQGYKYFSRGLSLILMGLVLVPLSVVTILSYSQYRQLLEMEERDQLAMNVDGARNTIDKFVEELQTVVKFVARDDLYQELLDSKELKALFDRLQNEYPDFADIEIVDSDGMKKAYIGPYQLENQNYSDQLWYKEVLIKGVYISNVFLGFRGIPHFVIAVSKELPQQQGKWVLRVTIDGKTLQRIINTISTTYVDDMFLVDSDCIAQTQPQKYGKLGEKCVLHEVKGSAVKTLNKRKTKNYVDEYFGSRLRMFNKYVDGKELIQAVVDLKNAPWKLMLVKEQYLHAEKWYSFQNKLLIIFIICSVIAVVIIIEISTAITNHLRESDKRRQQLYGEAEHCNKLASIGRLAAGVAHEINNPLSIINQKTGLVQDLMALTGDFEHKNIMAEAHKSIQNSVNRCKTITHRLLGFARQTDVKMEEIDINVVLREVVDFLAKEATYNQIQIDFSLDQNVSKIFSDQGPLQQIFLNITNNAIDAIGNHGKITISSRQIAPNTIQVKIVDDGPGMPEEIRKRIFEPFFTTKETGKGTGLGLSITYGLVTKLGGDIKVTTEIGKGTTFEITLPVKQSK